MHSLFPDICTDDVAASRDFYVALLGFRVAFEIDWYVQLQSPADANLQLAFVRRDHASVPEGFRDAPRGVLVTVETKDVDAVHARARPRAPRAAAGDLPERPRRRGARGDRDRGVDADLARDGSTDRGAIGKSLPEEVSGIRRFILLLALAALALAGACREEGAVEKVGKKIDETIDDLTHPNEGLVEELGRKKRSTT